jgi:hypothetical protein
VTAWSGRVETHYPARLAVIQLVLMTLIGCGGATTPVAPSLVPSSTPVASPAPPPSPPNTPTVLPRWSISGVVRDKDDGSGVRGVTVQIVDRFEPKTATTDDGGRYSFADVAQSGVGMVFSRSGYYDLTIEQVLPVKDLVVNVAITRSTCTTRPSPVPLSYSVSGRNVMFTWPEVSGALEYRLSVGQWDYVSPVFETTTSSTSYAWVNAAPGTYHARVQGRSECGFGNAANELKVVVP